MKTIVGVMVELIVADLTADSYYLVVANPNQRPIRYSLAVELDAPSTPPFARGDVNTDTRLNIADAIALLGHLFGGTGPLKCDDASDANDDGNLNIADAIAILGHLFGGTGALPDPFQTPGLDPTEDVLSCRCYQATPCVR